MYRTLLPVLLYTSAVYSAPQDSTDLTDTLPDLPQPGEEPLNLADRSDDTTDAYESSETTDYPTEKYIDDLIQQTEEYETRTKAPSPRFLSKLSYFQKDSYQGSPLINLIEKSNPKRKFKSKCRCEKIWNCPKLQITVPRCPEEYFMCCF